MESILKPLVYTRSCSKLGVPQPIMIEDGKYAIDIDEHKYSESVIIPGIRAAYPEADEARIQRLAQLEADIIACYFDLAFVEKQFKYRSYDWLLEKLRENERLDTISDDDVHAAFQRNLQNTRLQKAKFPDGHIKFRYNEFHREKLVPIEEPKIFKKLPDGKNPFA